jgi:hypothetical protein
MKTASQYGGGFAVLGFAEQAAETRQLCNLVKLKRKSCTNTAAHSALKPVDLGCDKGYN